MLKYGVPLHAFDSNKLNGQIYVEQAREDKTFEDLESNQIIVRENSLMIKDNSGNIALAGIMGGNKTKIDDTTHGLTFEIAFFNPSSIHKSRNLLAHKTDSEKRTEKILDFNIFEQIINEIIEYFGADLLINESYVKSTNDLQQDFDFLIELAYIKQLIGSEIPVTKIKQIYESLLYRNITITDTTIKITTPTGREINNQEDVISDLIRVYNINNLKTDDLQLLSINEISAQHQLELTIRQLGFDQIITYSLISEQLFEIFNLERNKGIKLIDPLSVDHLYYRSSLIPSLIKTLKYNLHNDNNKNEAFFEIGDVN